VLNANYQNSRKEFEDLCGEMNRIKSACVRQPDTITSEMLTQYDRLLHDLKAALDQICYPSAIAADQRKYDEEAVEFMQKWRGRIAHNLSRKATGKKVSLQSFKSL
jgi:hypothetical protein